MFRNTLLILAVLLAAGCPGKDDTADTGIEYNSGRVRSLDQGWRPLAADTVSVVPERR